MERRAYPPLYQRDLEHDACGIAAVVDKHGRRSHRVIELALGALVNLEHRGAEGAEPDTGDGAGILIQNPDSYWRSVVAQPLPPEGAYLTGVAFFDVGCDVEKILEVVMQIAAEERLVVLATREVPRDNSMIGATARACEPWMLQFFFGTDDGWHGVELERRGFALRRRLEHLQEEFYFSSLSTRTLVLKGMLSAPQVGRYFLDLVDPRCASAIALVHSRFSTNTLPSWRLAQPFRMVAHNGEINTIRGNRNWMRARESLCATSVIDGSLERLFPVITEGASDSASFDEVLELLTLTGRSLPHALMMMIPEAWENNTELSEDLRAFYQFHASLMEPWDGPAAIVCTDGTTVGAVLDRNGLRPARYWITDDDLVILASEVGVVEVDPTHIVSKGRLEPGRIFLVDTAEGRLVDDRMVKAELAAAAPWREWVRSNRLSLDALPPRDMLVPQHGSIVQRQQLFGYTEEEIRRIIAPMVRSGAEPVGSMGSDTSLPSLSQQALPFFDLFSQQFAQVTNPPLDAIREELVTSAGASIGPEGNLLEPTERSVRQIYVPHPIIDNNELAKLVYIDEDGDHKDLRAHVIDILFLVDRGAAGMAEAIEAIRGEAEEAIRGGAAVVVLSDRHADAQRAPIPSLLAVAAVHHHLVRTRLRTRAGLIIECGDAREVHHFATLIGFGAAAVNPYLAFDTIVDLIREGAIDPIAPLVAQRNFVKAATKGVIKTMSKMGISTISSYTGSQNFEATGVNSEVISEYFPGTPAPIDGVGLDEIVESVLVHHRRAYGERREELQFRNLEVGGVYQWRREGEYHLFNPETVFLLQHATRSRRYDVFRRYSHLVDDQARRQATLRGLLTLRLGERPPVPLDEVEPVSEIIKRFATGAMSYGSISQEAHETLAIAMNRIGGRSNSGEGGEDPSRIVPDAAGLDRRSRIKQVASGRFGVTSEYLVSADDIQIKMAQGAKPGEGGQLPGEKVYPWIAATRYATPGVGLISPPPHHDIYSIEDLAQLIYDLKSANPSARVHVKLVSEVGVGTVAAGVAKTYADVILISGGDGGTGAAPLSSLRHAGGPWELGLAEAQQTLLMNGLRDRIVLQVDGQLKTGRDVIVAALLGAEEFGFATAPLVVSGCIMMRVCHLDTCPVGIATQNPELRAKFSGKPEFVETFFEFVAQEVRTYLAELGFRSLEEAVGRSEVLEVLEHADASPALLRSLGKLTTSVEPWEGQSRRSARPQRDLLAGSLNAELVSLCQEAIATGKSVSAGLEIHNTDRAVGATLGYEVTRRHGAAGLAPDTVTLSFSGSAGQSFGAFLPRGVTLELIGDANDYLAKGLSGGRIFVRPPVGVSFDPETTIIAGNVILYGATGGEVFIRGVVGERFAVRNSGAVAVVEGVGDHGCEYMTGGEVVILGPVGRNFAAGMSGGVAFLFDPDETFSPRVNREMVDYEMITEDYVSRIVELLERHYAVTGSNRAAWLLEDPTRIRGGFRSVIPREYRRVMMEQFARSSELEPMPSRGGG
ncbi:MAG: glutamate synthase large subunit [Ferrimicrobium sp.]